MYDFYWYPKCSTCKKAKAWLEAHDIDFQTIDMIKNPPTAETIEEWLKHNEVPIRRLFNTSGMKYRELGLKDQITDFSIQQASRVLSSDGMLIKRPLIVKGKQLVAIGLNEKTYEGVLM
ncbi:arsenate reductase family protein [Enterococcus villorum]|uniref:Arsenate reductase n=2 Tax=Enterococcus villorum TaxID=112904 RepID=A0A511J3K7_9ENTE|nr:arsenate reductase family protein [Enterococcus villorum]EOH89052.1 spx/MgsR family transcriptional regulator [Enterococcus villorum ATCC 700913]EOW76319.1 arsenate reductase ArsC [Enterococcus villorum ATCC 700913]GEL92544.1 arsenate reductase [Enterococcus villorum]